MVTRRRRRRGHEEEKAWSRGGGAVFTMRRRRHGHEEEEPFSQGGRGGVVTVCSREPPEQEDTSRRCFHDSRGGHRSSVPQECSRIGGVFTTHEEDRQGGAVFMRRCSPGGAVFTTHEEEEVFTRRTYFC